MLQIKSLIHYPFIEKEISLTALSHYLSFNYTSTQDAIFQGMFKLPPATYLHYDLRNYQYEIHEYWSLSSHFYLKSNFTLANAQEELNALLGTAIKSQLTADVPLGAFLSGGH